MAVQTQIRVGDVYRATRHYGNGEVREVDFKVEGPVTKYGNVPVSLSYEKNGARVEKKSREALSADSKLFSPQNRVTEGTGEVINGSD